MFISIMQRIVKVNDDWFKRLYGIKTLVGKRGAFDWKPQKGQILKLKNRVTKEIIASMILEVTLYAPFDNIPLGDLIGKYEKTDYVEVLKVECIDISNARTNVAGALALDIRGSWRDAKYRFQRMITLLEANCKYSLVSWLYDHEENIFDDGRALCGWSGPYDVCRMIDLIALDLTPRIFAYPESVIDDFDKFS